MTPNACLAGRILTADDQAINRRLLTVLLTSRGHLVSEADCVAAALVELRQCSFELVLLDIAMPAIDGFALLDLIRRDPILFDLQVVRVTGNCDKESEINVFKRGAAGYLTKPVQATSLHATVNACIERRRARLTERQVSADLKAEYELSLMELDQQLAS
ncbi:MAG: response regulator [Myxococcales bacterium]|nr:response regulator [Myxococcales bacterium]